jgi:hypothetical protein
MLVKRDIVLLAVLTLSLLGSWNESAPAPTPISACQSGTEPGIPVECPRKVIANTATENTGGNLVLVGPATCDVEHPIA